MYIYLITNLVSGQRYVGQTIQTVALRWQGHIRDTRRGFTYPICNAIRKYGSESFAVMEVDVARSRDELNVLEPFYIRLFNTRKPHGYNLDSGGKNYATHDETKAKISQANRGNKYCLGRVLSDETKAKISRANKGKRGRLGQRNSPEHIAKTSAGLRGKPSWNKGGTMRPESRAKLSASRTGKRYGPLSAKHRAAISAGRNRYFQKLKEERTQANG